MCTKSNIRRIGFLVIPIFLISLLFLTVDVYSSEDVIYQRAFFSGDEFLVNGVQYSVHSQNFDRMLIRSPDYNFWVLIGECSSRGNVNVCFQSAEFDDVENDYRINMRVSLVYPKITLSQTSEKSSMVLGDESKIDVIIRNDGLIGVDKATYRQEIPSGFKVIEGFDNSLSVIGNAIVWESALSADEEKEFSYVLRATGKNSEPLQAEVSFFDGFNIKYAYSNLLALNVDSPYILELIPNSTDFFVGDKIEFTLRFTNDADERVTISKGNVHIPDSFNVISKSNQLQENSGRLEFSGEVLANRNVELKFTLMATDSGVFDVSSLVDIYGFSFMLDKSVRLTSTRPETKFRLFFVQQRVDEPLIQNLKENSVLEGQQRGQFELFFENPYNHQISDVRVAISSELLNMTSSIIPIINSKSTRKLIDNSYVTPALQSARRNTLEINFTYFTEFGYLHFEIVEKDITIQPLRDIEVRHSLSNNRPESGDTVRVTVTARNTRRSDLDNVFLREIIPEGFVYRGATEGRMSISSGTTATFYEYFIELPVVSREVNIELLTIAKYADSTNDFEISVPYVFTVRPRNPDLVIRRTRVPLQRNPRIGEIIEIDYELRNREEYRMDQIDIEFPAIKGTYLVDSIKSTISSLNPGQERKLEKVERRVVFDDVSSISLGRTNVFLTDDQGIRHRLESPALTVSLDTEVFNLPKLYISKEITSSSHESFDYVVKIENVGNMNSEFTLVDGARTLELSVESGDSIEIDGSERFDNYASLMLPRSYLYFERGPNKYYAVTNNIDLEDYILEIENVESIDEEIDDDVDNEPDESQIHEEIESDERDETDDYDDPVIVDENESVSIFGRFWNYLKGLFGF